MLAAAGYALGGDLQLGHARATGAGTTASYWAQGDYLGIGCGRPLPPGRAAVVERAHPRALHRGRRAPGERAGGRRGDLTDEQRRVRAPRPGAAHAGRGARTGRSPDDPDLDGLVERRDGRAVLTVRGRLLANEVTVRLVTGPQDGAAGQPVSSSHDRGEPRRAAHGPRQPTTSWRRMVNLCKRRGFIFPSAEIYGGFRSTYDYGPLGVNMLRNVKDAWWRAMVQLRDDVVGLDAAILSPPTIWEASGHLANFTDPLVDCRNCQERWRADKIDGVCPNCGSTDLTEARAFNLMFKTHAGPGRGRGRRRLPAPRDRPGDVRELPNVLTTTRKKPPFGIAQVGKSFRNEITPQNFVFRTREFEQMEMEYFVPPDEADKWFHYWLDERMPLVSSTSASPSRRAAPAPPRRRRAVALLGRHRRRGVPLPVGLGRARRASPTGPTST